MSFNVIPPELLQDILIEMDLKAFYKVYKRFNFGKDKEYIAKQILKKYNVTNQEGDLLYIKTKAKTNDLPSVKLRFFYEKLYYEKVIGIGRNVTNIPILPYLERQYDDDAAAMDGHLDVINWLHRNSRNHQWN